MNWREEYADRIVSPKEAVSHIKSGDRVVVDHACGEPYVITDAMATICTTSTSVYPNSSA